MIAIVIAAAAVIKIIIETIHDTKRMAGWLAVTGSVTECGWEPGFYSHFLGVV